MLKHKKRSKEQRQKERKIQADLYNEAFTHGYEIGLRVGKGKIDNSSKGVYNVQSTFVEVLGE